MSVIEKLFNETKSHSKNILLQYLTDKVLLVKSGYFFLRVPVVAAEYLYFTSG